MASIMICFRCYRVNDAIIVMRRTDLYQVSEGPDAKGAVTLLQE
jgi:hypothetical protein